jgi:hypothetical protein
VDREGVFDESNSFPAELMSPTPRSVRLSGTGWLNLLAATLFFVLGVAGGVTIVKYVLHEAAAQNALRHHGDEALGQITEMWTKRSVPHISYSFSVDGVRFSGNSVVPTTRSRSQNRGDSLPIRYIPADPNINHPAAWEDSPYSALWMLPFPAAIAFCGLMLIRRFPVQRQLAMKGIAVRGRISRTDWNGPSKGQRYASYTFRNANNDEVEVGSCPSDYIYKAEVNCWVLYLPTNPKRNEIYPFPIEFFRVTR